ncbi:nicotinate (nicotinamide) nucleotide adenylyltransferase [Dysgonomonas macrotermitis]|uniref:Probable nicotinate-nucleotide adenylyltransferase n=1 Tax=Dysgonomonas macrotermitis TaxID=1346286 RepID=A0A1M5G892_9BACT|nr:nicotinate (nicotinamide) nucleotide adenylyltransferase [Dysgonomonas macrotermitis]SHF99949.1 nicotinate-nucleotide adenylyltransferase [Dysgonomonas macrotermitis]
MKVGVFSGSFNPIHVGHLVLANYITEFVEIDEIWFLVTPQNPLKENTELIDEVLRLDMTRLALEDYPKLKASDFEFTLPRPSYTIHTLDALQTKHPEHEFSLIIGADNWDNFHLWKDYKSILDGYRVYVYPRLETTLTIPKGLRDRVEAMESPIIEISSTFIRESIAEGKDLMAFLPEKVYRYIKDKDLYKNN